MALNGIVNNNIPSIEDRVAESTEIWAKDLQNLFDHARDRFGDVTWEAEDGGERLWGHKAVIYARAPKAFKDRYFSSRPYARTPTSLRSPSPSNASHLLPPLFPSSAGSPQPPPTSFRHLSSRVGAGSSLSVQSYQSEQTIRAGGGDGILRLTHGDTPELFCAQLEWLYTGEGFGDVVEWIDSDDESGNAGNGRSIRDSLGRRGNQAERRDKLGQDLTYMWRSKLYADVRIHLDNIESLDSASDDSDSSEDSVSSTAIFTAHRWMLVSRSPYFASVLLNGSSFRPATADIRLPTPPFTPASLHFCLGYMYAGHLDFSNRSFDLLTAFQIHKAAAYLQMDSLTREIEARIVHEFCHGLDFTRCGCRKCVVRAARVWKFASSPDVGAIDLAAKARKYLVRGWGECWGKDVGTADEEDREALNQEVIGSINHGNVIDAFRCIARIKIRMEQAIRSKGREAADWVKVIEELLEQIQEHTRTVLVSEFSRVAEGKELWSLIAGKGFSMDLLEIVFRELVDGADDAKRCLEAPRIYQTIVSSILLKVHSRTLQPVLLPRSSVRQTVEVAREGILKHIRRRWMRIRDSGNFDHLENWALKEISDEIEVSVDELLYAGLGSPVDFPQRQGDRVSIPRTTSHVMSLNDATPTSPRSRVSFRPSTTTNRCSAGQEISTDSSGLRRLRLSSAASTSSAISTRSISSRHSVTPVSSPPRSGPQPRSPTAARQGPTVPLGQARARAIAARAGASSPSPTVASQATMRTMSGPPKPLMARGAAAKTGGKTKASPGSTASTTSTAGTTSNLSVAGPSRVRQAETRTPSPGPSLRSVKSNRTLRSTAGPSKPSSSTPMPTPRKSTTTEQRTPSTTSIRQKALSTASKAPPGGGPTSSSIRKAVSTKSLRTPKSDTTTPIQATPALTTGRSTTSTSSPRTKALSTASRAVPGDPSVIRKAVSSKSLRDTKPAKTTMSPTPDLPLKPAAPQTAEPSTKVDTPTRPVFKSKSKPNLRGPNITKVTPPTPNQKEKIPATQPETKSAPTNRTASGSTTNSVRSRVSALNQAAAAAATGGPQRVVTPPLRPAPSTTRTMGPPPLVPRVRAISASSGISPRKGKEAASVATTGFSKTPVPPVPRFPGRAVSAKIPSTTTPASVLEESPPVDAPPELSGLAKDEAVDTIADGIKSSPIIPMTASVNTSPAVSTPRTIAQKTSLTSSRIRNMSSPASQSRSSFSSRPPPSAMPNLLPPMRSASASTDETLGARTPRSSDAAAAEPLIRRNDSFGSDMLSPPLPSNRLPIPPNKPRATRKGSASSVISANSAFRVHPASAFDPPRRPVTPLSPVERVIQDGSVPYDGPGVSLHMGIPCVVSLETRRARFRAQVKYIGRMKDTPGTWVGLEVEDLDRLGIETLPTGSKDGIHYFHLTPPEDIDFESKLARQRQVDRIQDSLGGQSRKSRLMGLGLGLPSPTIRGGMMSPPSSMISGGAAERWSKRSASPFVGGGDWSPLERPRALFVKPSEVVFVMGGDA